MTEETISAADASRQLPRLLRMVRAGHSYVVTIHGRPIAKIVPLAGLDQMNATSRAALLARLRSEPAIDAGRWTRDELYDGA